MDLGTLVGLIVGGLAVLGTVVLAAAGAGDISGMLMFLNPPGALLVFGGTIAVAFIGFPVVTTLTGLKSFGKALKPPDVDPAVAITKIIELANQARKEGILALEESAQQMDDAFLQKGIMLIVDGTDPELVRSILETELSYIETRHGQIRGVWEFMAAQAPAWGMMGTLISLIIMLQNLSDPGSLGPAMAVAIITTLYGALVANYIALPIASKLKQFSSAEMLMKEVLIEGMLSIQAGENPRIIEEKLKAFLAPTIRAQVGQGAGKPGGAAGDDD